MNDAVPAEASARVGSVSVREAGTDDAPRWDAFVQAHPDGTFFHLSAWRDVIGRVFGHRAHYLLAERDGAPVGVLPLGEIRSLLFGHALISVPFCVYGGPVASDDGAERALEDAARALARRLGVDYLELRRRVPGAEAAEPDPLYVTFSKPISDDADANLKAIPRKQRAMVRKGMQAGLVAEVDDGVERFFALYSESVRNLGTPVLPRRWFATVKEVFADACEVLTVTHEGRPVASVLSYYFRDQVLPYYGGGGADARALKANDFMYYALMGQAAARGARVFDYGRSKRGSGSYDFKRNWGFEPAPLYYQYHLVRAERPPALNPENPKYRLAIAAWKRMPVALSRRLGPFVAKYLA